MVGATEVISLSNQELTRFFFAIVLLLVAAHSVGYLFQRLRMPRVIGEIVGGLTLGPTILGFLSPDAYTWVFNAFPSEGKMLSLIYWIGLVLLMFVSGFEMETKIDKRDRKDITALLIGATAIPLVGGWLSTYLFDFTPFIGYQNNELALRLVITIAVAVTSIPVISKIFIDLNIMKTRFSKIVLATATIQDILLWIALAVATGVISSQTVTAGSIATTVIVTIVFFAVMLLLMPRIIHYGNKLRANILIRSSASGYALLICFLFAAIASILDVNIVFGAFLAGIIVGKIKGEDFKRVKVHIKEISLAFFTPIYFAIVGLKLDLLQSFDLTFFLGFLLLSAVLETFGTILAAKIIKKSWLSSFNLGVAMNTRGGPGIILATVAFDLGIINETFFVTLVLVAIVTSLLAGAWFRMLLNRGIPLLTEEEEPATV